MHLTVATRTKYDEARREMAATAAAGMQGDGQRQQPLKDEFRRLKKATLSFLPAAAAASRVLSYGGLCRLANMTPHLHSPAASAPG